MMMLQTLYWCRAPVSALAKFSCQKHFRTVHHLISSFGSESDKILQSNEYSKNKSGTLNKLCLHPSLYNQKSNFGVDSTKRQEEGQEKGLTIWKNLKELRQSPVPALTLGFSGLIPFVAAPVYLITTGAILPNIVFAQIVYGASILSFLGGVRWGYALDNGKGVQPNWFNLSYSVMPSLVAWTAVLMPETLGVLTLIGGLGGTLYMDMILPGYPAWFKGLRFLLGFGAILSLWTTLTCKYLLKTSSAKDTIEIKEDSEQSD